MSDLKEKTVSEQQSIVVAGNLPTILSLLREYPIDSEVKIPTDIQEAIIASNDLTVVLNFLEGHKPDKKLLITKEQQADIIKSGKKSAIQNLFRGGMSIDRENHMAVVETEDYQIIESFLKRNLLYGEDTKAKLVHLTASKNWEEKLVIKIFRYCQQGYIPKGVAWGALEASLPVLYTKLVKEG